jgi:monofunctional biosynthetic peptidoglycan transglycosylase
MRLFARAVAIALAIGFGYVSYVYLTLPDVRALRTTNPAQTAFMSLRAREAEARGERVARDQRWVPYSRIAQNLKRAVLVTEDSAFWTHDGVDLEQVRESMEVNWERGEFARGASTITQQLARNLYLSPSKNLVRKVRELLIARRLEASLSKQRIFELYLNVIEWGDNVWGAEAAARRYFHKSAGALDASESALLAGAISNPRAFDPAHPSARLKRRQQMIMRRMGAATPPPVVPEPVLLPVEAPAFDSVPALPPVTAPTTLPGTPVQPDKGPGKPGGG